MSTKIGQLTADDLEFLKRPLHGFFTAAAGAIPPQPRPVWLEATSEGTVQLITVPDTVRLRQLRSDSRASLVVAAPAGERERWVSVAGPTTVESDGASDLARRLADRYWGTDDPTRVEARAELMSSEWVRVVIHPETVQRYHFE